MLISLNHIFELTIMNNFTREEDERMELLELKKRLLVHFWERAKYELQTRC